MRLLNTRTGHFQWVNNPRQVRFAILSHVWDQERGEQSFADLCKIQDAVNVGRASLSPSCLPEDAVLMQVSAKIRDACACALARGYDLIWIDSCCIDQASSAELSEAINSMYTWYGLAAVCYAFLPDVGDADEDSRLDNSRFRSSVWFTRGWTLQELIAPNDVLFFSSTWQLIGTKHDLVDVVEDVTRIDKGILTGIASLESVSVARRMSWASTRVTTREEDEAYSLMGIFGVNIPTIYGEGRKAFFRLQQEILRDNADQSIFVWDWHDELSRSSQHGDKQHPLLASSPVAFMHSGSVRPISRQRLFSAFWLPSREESDGDQAWFPPAPYETTPFGVRTTFPIIRILPKPLNAMVSRPSLPMHSRPSTPRYPRPLTPRYSRSPTPRSSISLPVSNDEHNSQRRPTPPVFPPPMLVTHIAPSVNPQQSQSGFINHPNLRNHPQLTTHLTGDGIEVAPLACEEDSSILALILMPVPDRADRRLDVRTVGASGYYAGRYQDEEYHPRIMLWPLGAHDDALEDRLVRVVRIQSFWMDTLYVPATIYVVDSPLLLALKEGQLCTTERNILALSALHHSTAPEYNLTLELSADLTARLAEYGYTASMSSPLHEQATGPGILVAPSSAYVFRLSDARNTLTLTFPQNRIVPLPAVKASYVYPHAEVWGTWKVDQNGLKLTNRFRLPSLSPPPKESGSGTAASEPPPPQSGVKVPRIWELDVALGRVLSGSSNVPAEFTLSIDRIEEIVNPSRPTQPRSVPAKQRRKGICCCHLPQVQLGYLLLALLLIPAAVAVIVLVTIAILRR